MIRLTRINHAAMVLNSDLIEHIENTPDTVITLTTGQKFMVLESVEEVIRRVIEFRRNICERVLTCSVLASRAAPEDEPESSGEGEDSAESN